MKNLIIGFIIGVIFAGSVAFAAARLTIQNGSGTEVGTSANPFYVVGV